MFDMLLLFISISFFITLGLGLLLEKMRIPWIFGALILGMFLAWNNPFASVTSSQTFQWLGRVGMYFLLFIIGFEINVKEWLKQGKLITELTFIIIPFTALFGAIFFKFIFNIGWVVASIAALSFATVGEAILVPILDEFKLINKKIGQIIIGAGTLDDVFEVTTLILVSLLYVGKTVSIWNSIYGLISIGILFMVAVLFTKINKKNHKFKVPEIGTIFIFIISIMFLFCGAGSIGDSAALGALFAGIAVKNFIPKQRLKFVEKEIKSVSYGLFSPLFFLWVGISTDVSYLLVNIPLLILAVIISILPKIIGTLLVAYKNIGIKASIFSGTALSVRFSTSIVLIKIMLDYNIIPLTMYSIIIATTVVLQFIIPGILAYLITRWKKDINV